MYSYIVYSSSIFLTVFFMPNALDCDTNINVDPIIYGGLSSRNQ